MERAIVRKQKVWVEVAGTKHRALHLTREVVCFSTLHSIASAWYAYRHFWALSCKIKFVHTLEHTVACLLSGYIM
jgi:hypothetical protein